MPPVAGRRRVRRARARQEGRGAWRGRRSRAARRSRLWRFRRGQNETGHAVQISKRTLPAREPAHGSRSRLHSGWLRINFGGGAKLAHRSRGSGSNSPQQMANREWKSCWPRFAGLANGARMPQQGPAGGLISLKAAPVVKAPVIMSSLGSSLPLTPRLEAVHEDQQNSPRACPRPRFSRGEPRARLRVHRPALGRGQDSRNRSGTGCGTAAEWSDFGAARTTRSGTWCASRGGAWAFHYDVFGDPDDDETGYRFGDHAFVPGEYVSINEHDDVVRTFRVVSVQPLE